MSAEEAAPVPTAAQPLPEHRWLERMVGEWDFVAEADMGDGQTHRSEGTESVRSLNGVWIVAEASAPAPDGSAHTNIIQLGYDPAVGRYVGSFISSFMTRFWAYEGAREGDRLVLETEGPSFTGEGTSPYRDIVEITGDDTRELRSQTPGPDGGWLEFMVSRYTRRR